MKMILVVLSIRGYTHCSPDDANNVREIFPLPQLTGGYNEKDTVNIQHKSDVVEGPNGVHCCYYTVVVDI